MVLHLFRSCNVFHMAKLVPQLVHLPWLVLLEAVVQVLVYRPVVVVAGTLQDLHFLLVTEVDVVDTDIHLVMLHTVPVPSGILLWQLMTMFCVKFEYCLLLLVVINDLNLDIALKTASPLSLAALHCSGFKPSHWWGSPRLRQ